MDYLRSQIETLIFCANAPIKAKDIQLALAEMLGTKVNLRDVKKDIAALVEKYQTEEFTFEICHLANGYQFLTKPNYQKIIEIYLGQKSRRGLSQSALETLAIIAYKQPITKSQIEAIRGMGSDYTVRKLLEKELITIRGKAPTPGRPILYGTSNKFMHYFGINSIEDLPFPEDLEGEQDGFEEEEGLELRAIDAIDVSFQAQEDKKDMSELLEEAGEELQKEKALEVAEELLRKQSEEAQNEAETEFDEDLEEVNKSEDEAKIEIEEELEEVNENQIQEEFLNQETEREFVEEVKSEIEILPIEIEETILEEEVKKESDADFFETIDDEHSSDLEDDNQNEKLDDFD